jgi:hypothetical protein
MEKKVKIKTIQKIIVFRRVNKKFRCPLFVKANGDFSNYRLVTKLNEINLIEGTRNKDVHGNELTDEFFWNHIELFE